MTPIEFENQTHLIAAPENWPHHLEPMSVLPVRFDTRPDGVPTIVSYWRPTPAELAILAEGGYIRLTAFDLRQQPVALSAEHITALA